MGMEESLFQLTDLGLPESWFPAAIDPHALESGGAAAPAVNAMNEVSGRDLILLAGGLFLIGKSTHEIHAKLEGPAEHHAGAAYSSFSMILFQIILLDAVFSLDSVITAVGMAQQIWVMVTAMVIAVAVMLIFSGGITRFVHRHPTLKILALSFLILIGVLLVADGIGQHISRGYVYFAMAFSLIVEMINLRVRSKSAPVELHEPPPIVNN
jgi:predicted tellurium resistance membrane protein TerC